MRTSALKKFQFHLETLLQNTTDADDREVLEYLLIDVLPDELEFAAENEGSEE